MVTNRKSEFLVSHDFIKIDVIETKIGHRPNDWIETETTWKLYTHTKYCTIQVWARDFIERMASHMRAMFSISLCKLYYQSWNTDCTDRKKTPIENLHDLANYYIFILTLCLVCLIALRHTVSFFSQLVLVFFLCSV